MNGLIKYDISPLSVNLGNIFILVVNILYSHFKLIGNKNVYPANYADTLLKEVEPTFDFIIVGGGTSGCVLAMKLTNIPTFTVLLIEEGDYPPPASDIPGLQITLPLTDIDWQYRLEKQTKGCQGMINSVCTLSRGKVLGGTSVIHDMNYIRSYPDDTEKMDILLWNSNLTELIYYTLENYQNNTKNNQYKYGNNGKTFLEKFIYYSPIKSLLEQFYQQTGYSQIPEKTFLGYMNHLAYMRNGVRLNAAKLYINPIRGRPNLFVAVKSHVKSIDIGHSLDKRANGVNVIINKQQVFVRARKEVILTSGPINNAKLLMMSGIGNEKHLKQFNIRTIVNNPFVGKNLQFHLCLPLFFTINYEDTFNQVEYVGEIINYILSRKGSLNSTNLNDFVHYINTQNVPFSIPNLAIYHRYFQKHDATLEIVLRSLKYNPNIIKSLLKHNNDKVIIMFTLHLMRPESRGEVLLNENNIEAQPRIIPNFLSDKNNLDYDTLLSGFKYLTNLTNFEFMQKHNLEFLNIDIPNCRNYKICTFYYAKCYILTMSYPTFDIAGTTKMGPKCQRDIVVEKDLQVKGVRCLRVGDASVLQFIPSDNTVASEAMIAFRLSELIRKQWLENYDSPFQINDDTDSNENVVEEENVGVNEQMKSVIEIIQPFEQTD